MPLTLIAITNVENTEQGLASGIFTTATQTGGALGIAILSTLASTRAGATGYELAFTVATGLMIAALLHLGLLRSNDVS